MPRVPRSTARPPCWCTASCVLTSRVVALLPSLWRACRVNWGLLWPTKWMDREAARGVPRDFRRLGNEKKVSRCQREGARVSLAFHHADVPLWMQLFGYLAPQSCNSTDTAARGIEPPMRLYRQIVQGKQYNMNNPAFMGVDLGDDVIARDWDPTLNRWSGGVSSSLPKAASDGFVVLTDRRKKVKWWEQAPL